MNEKSNYSLVWPVALADGTALLALLVKWYQHGLSGNDYSNFVVAVFFCHVVLLPICCLWSSPRSHWRWDFVTILLAGTTMLFLVGAWIVDCLQRFGDYRNPFDHGLGLCAIFVLSYGVPLLASIVELRKRHAGRWIPFATLVSFYLLPYFVVLSWALRGTL